jgi:hypothetical protein
MHQSVRLLVFSQKISLYLITVSDRISKDTALHLEPEFTLDQDFTVVIKHTPSSSPNLGMSIASVGFDKSPADASKDPSSADPLFVFMVADHNLADILVYNGGSNYLSVAQQSRLLVSNANSQMALVQDVTKMTWTLFVSNWSSDGTTTSTSSVVLNIPSAFKWLGTWVRLFFVIQMALLSSYDRRPTRSLRARLKTQVG